jgi:hypothetical protein
MTQGVSDASSPIVVIGMHRSGTSALGGALTKLGVYFGESADLFGPDAWNQAGYFEYKKLVTLNDELLATVGAAWDAPPDAEGRQRLAQAPAALLDRGREICAELAQSASGQPWGFKDPRICLTWPFWRGLISQPRVIGCLRSPTEIAASLSARNKVSREFGLRLCAAYLADLEKAITESGGALLCYADLVQWPQATLDSVCEHLHIPRNDAALAWAVEHLRPELAHQRLAADDESAHPAFVAYRSLLAIPHRIDPAKSGESKVVWERPPTPTLTPEAERHRARLSAIARGMGIELTPEDLELAPDTTLVARAGAAWRDQRMEAAIAMYVAAFVAERHSAEVTFQFASFLLIHLSAIRAKAKQPQERKRALRAFLALNPGSKWAIETLVRLAAEPFDREVIRGLSEDAERWSEEVKASVKSTLHSLDPNAQQKDLQLLLARL